MRKLLAFTTTVLIIAALYTASLFYSRWSESRDLRRRALQKAANDARFAVNAYGGDKLTVLQFFVTPPVVHPGQSAQLCYGVSNAKSVRIEPPVQNVWPSQSHCVEVAPKHTTTYRLFAEDAKGHIETAIVPLKVR
jgi:hypothetical protein